MLTYLIWAEICLLVLVTLFTTKDMFEGKPIYDKICKDYNNDVNKIALSLTLSATIFIIPIITIMILSSIANIVKFNKKG